MSFLQKLESKYCVVSGAQEITRKKLKSVKSLEELLEKIQSDERRDEPILSDRDMSNLPTFGGEAPNDTHGVYSWDKTRLLIQTNTGWKIVKRNEQPVGVADSEIEMTPKIKNLLKKAPKKHWKQILKRAWDACCDGEALTEEYGELRFDPWDGKHEEKRREIEEDMVAAVIEDY